MRIEKIKYTAQYDEFGVLKAQWIGLEGAIDDTEVAENKLDEIKAITERWYAKQNPHLQPQGPPTYDGNSVSGPRVIETERTSEDVMVADLIRTIYACTQLDGNDGLQAYYKMASTYKEALLAYNVMKNKLVAKESKEILDATEAGTMMSGHKLLDGYNKNTRIKKDKPPYESLDDNK